MKTTMKLFTLACMIVAISLTSCDKEGPQGPIGPGGIAGIDGEDGISGTDGINGTNGTDGTNGVDGEDGENGNANVSSRIIDITNASGNTYSVSSTFLTADNVENGVVLAYIKAGNEWYQIPNQRIFTNGFSLIDISSSFRPFGQNYTFHLFFLQDGIPVSISAGDLDELRLIAIPATNTSGKISSISPLDKLYNEGIDLTDYFQVLEYYGLEK